MKRLHVNVGVADLEQSIRFYATLFGAEPSVRESDYAKWMLDDPRVNFAISTRTAVPGLDHLGIQAETAEELSEIGERLKAADTAMFVQKDAACCYARSDKAWVQDPAGLSWETFHTTGSITTYGGDTARTANDAAGPTAAASACCAPASPSKAMAPQVEAPGRSPKGGCGPSTCA